MTEVGISRKHCIFESELRAYLALYDAGVKYVPQLLGIFNVPGKGAMLFTMVGKNIKELSSLHDR
jgi:hypothetical protein